MDVKAKIAALLAMTREAGCSEAEALAAAKKAAALMLEYGMSAADVYIDDQTVHSKTKGRGARDHLWPVVADCTNTACVFISGRRGADVQFIGRAPGPEIAAYLFTIMDRAIDRGIAEFRLPLDQVESAFPCAVMSDSLSEPPRVYRSVCGSMIRLLFGQRSSLRRRSPLLRSG